MRKAAFWIKYPWAESQGRRPGKTYSPNLRTASERFRNVPRISMQNLNFKDGGDRDGEGEGWNRSPGTEKSPEPGAPGEQGPLASKPRPRPRTRRPPAGSAPRAIGPGGPSFPADDRSVSPDPPANAADNLRQVILRQSFPASRTTPHPHVPPHAPLCVIQPARRTTR